jgi:3-dehydroquinate dehydratase-2
LAETVFILNGPNLNLLGKREPEIYGAETLADVEAACADAAEPLGLTIRFHQSNREYELIDWIHEAREAAAGIIINPAAFTHTSVAIHVNDNPAVAMQKLKGTCPCPILEVHISNIHKREPFRHHSYVSSLASGVIAGFGTQGYVLALHRMQRLVRA